MKYRRKYKCALCGEDVIFERVINGWTVSCGCGTAIRESGPNLELLEKIGD
jgi:DNA-directed RNA polymerase subunit RPC12/RpoP